MTKKNSGLFRIQAHARLHLGFFDLHGGLGRKFGSLGLALANPVTELEAYASATLQIKGDLDAKSRETISKIIQNLRNHFNLQASCSFNIKQLIPNHVGFGSGTQLALSVVALFNKLYDLNMSQTEISAFSGRGARSGIGLGTFFQGGVVVDAGRSAGNPIPPVIARMNFPEEWRILLIRDNQQVGIYGQLELEAFNQLPEFPPALAAKLCRHVLMQALPALYESDLPSFGEAVNALQLATGEHFASAQDGLYASKNVENVLNFLESHAVKCLGQSSWGPTGFAILENDITANALLVKLEKYFACNTYLSFSLTQAYNEGASILVV